jgi:hypothetical protein
MDHHKNSGSESLQRSLYWPSDSKRASSDRGYHRREIDRIIRAEQHFARLLPLLGASPLRATSERVVACRVAAREDLLPPSVAKMTIDSRPPLCVSIDPGRLRDICLPRNASQSHRRVLSANFVLARMMGPQNDQNAPQAIRRPSEGQLRLRTRRQ